MASEPVPAPAPPAVERIEAYGALPAPGGAVRQEPASPGPAYIATTGSGLVRLDDGGRFTSVPGSPTHIWRMVPGPKGALWVIVPKGLQRYDPEAGFGAPVALPKTVSNFDELAVGPKGEVWLAGLYGVHRYEKGAWTFWKSDAFQPPIKTSLHLAVDAAGRAWIATQQGLYLHPGGAGAWRAVPTAGDAKPAGRTALLLGSIAIGVGSGGAAAIYVQITGGLPTGLLRIDPGGWSIQRPLAGGRFSPAHIAAPGGELVYGAGSETLQILRPDGAAARVVRVRDDFNAQRIGSLFVDRGGRAWLATDNGLVVAGAAGGLWQWARGSVPAIRHGVRSVYVKGQGPRLPEGTPAPQLGRISGRITRGSAPLAAVGIELCPSPSMFAKQSPCRDAPAGSVAHLKSGPDGRFLTDPLPLGAYGVALEVPPKPGVAKKWKVLLGSCCARMTSSEIWDIGDVDADAGVILR